MPQHAVDVLPSVDEGDGGGRGAGRGAQTEKGAGSCRLLRGEVLPPADPPPPAYILPRLVRASLTARNGIIPHRTRVLTMTPPQPLALAHRAVSLPSHWEHPSVRPFALRCPLRTSHVPTASNIHFNSSFIVCCNSTTRGRHAAESTADSQCITRTTSARRPACLGRRLGASGLALATHS